MAQGSPAKYFAFQAVGQSKQHPDLPPCMCQSPHSWMLCCITSNPGPISSFQGSQRPAVGSAPWLASWHRKPRQGRCAVTAVGMSRTCPPCLASSLLPVQCIWCAPCPQQA